MPRRKQGWAKRVQKDRFKKKFLSKQQAQRLLQIDSMQFRRLCILKGIYPRSIARSKQKDSGNSKQYYLAREVKWLVHDNVLGKFYDFSSWEKKIRRAKAMQLKRDLDDLQKFKPGYKLDATIKERYPFFRDALRDIDDAMSTIALFAFLSPEVKSDTTIEFHHALSSGLHQRSRDMLKRWLDFVAKSHSLSKGFLSIKGYYYEAVIKSEHIVWLMPHEYASKMPKHIQQYIMVTFLEFYLELMRFILFKLEKDLETQVDEADVVDDEGVNANAEDFAPGAVLQEGQNLPKPAMSSHASKSERELIRKLFDGFIFYVSREVQRKHAELVITSCGGRVVAEYSNAVTHYIVDRPDLIPGHEKHVGVEYLQPQYLFDCLNARFLLPVEGYRMGETLPPHVSPFTVSISNHPDDVRHIVETHKLHPKMLNYIAPRVHEIRRIIDPNYTYKESKLEDQFEDDSEDDLDALGPERDAHDEVALSRGDVRKATQKPRWEDETVKERPERSALSALKVEKQRVLGLANKPTDASVAAKRKERTKSVLERKRTETHADKLKRKIREEKKSEAARRKLALQVARKKAARYYRMVSGAVESGKRKENVLARKAQRLASGSAKISQDGTTFVGGKRKHEPNEASLKRARKDSNPYKKLPKWVQ